MITNDPLKIEEQAKAARRCRLMARELRALDETQGYMRAFVHDREARRIEANLRNIANRLMRRAERLL